MNSRIAVLSDNRVHDPQLKTEHGLCLAVYLNEDFWLWDTGQSDLFLKNAKKMGIDPGKAKGLALSHGHYDHTGGLGALLNKTKFKGKIYAHPEFTAKRYAVKDEKARYIGIKQDETLINPPNLITVTETAELDRGLTFLTGINRLPDLFQAVNGFYFDEAGDRPDPVQDDAALILQTGGKNIVILGCGHSGLANTLYHAKDVMGVKEVFAVIGGLHLMNAPRSAFEETLSVLTEFSVKQVYPGHCVGDPAIAYLKHHLPGRVTALGTGMWIEFPN